MTLTSDYWKAGVMLIGVTAKEIIDSRDKAVAGAAAIDIILAKIKNPLG